MKVRREFSNEFKHQVLGELLSGASSPAQICRKYEISSGLLYHWKRQYKRGKFDNEPTREGKLEERIRELERVLGQKTFEIELLKKVLEKSVSRMLKKESSLPHVGEEKRGKD